MKRKHIAATVCAAAVLGLGGVMAASAGARQIVRVENGNRVVTELESSSANEPGYGAENGAWQEEGSEMNGLAPDTVKMWGTMNQSLSEMENGSFSFNRMFDNGDQEEVIVHVDPDQTLILDSMTGFPADPSTVPVNAPACVYSGPAMTMSLPPQVTAVMILVNIPQDVATPEYLTAAGPLTEDGQGGYLLQASDGTEWKVPADCEIIPYLTRQMVRLSDIQSGSRCLVWMGADNQVQKIVLFND